MDKWSDTVFYYEKGHHHRQNQQASSAVISYKRALAIDSQTASAYDDLGRVLYEQKSYGRAGKFFQRAFVRASYIPEISCYWGLCLSKQKKYKQAAEQFRIVVANPFYSPARAPYELGKALFHQHLYKEALEVLEKDALKNPLNSEVQAQFQEALFYVGDFEKALETATRTLTKYFEDPKASNIRGLLFLIEGHDEEARKCFEKAVDKDKECTYAWVNWSMVLLQQGKKRKAVETLKKGIDFIEEGVNVKDEIEEMIKYYKHLSDMLEKKALQASDEKEKNGLEKMSAMIKFILDYLENPNLDDLIETILNEEAQKIEEKKDESSEDEAHRLEENEFEYLENKISKGDEGSRCEVISNSPIERKNRLPDLLNRSDPVSNNGGDEFEEKKQEYAENRTSNENCGKNKDASGMVKDSSIETKSKFHIQKEYYFVIVIPCICLMISVFIFYRISKSKNSERE